MPPGVGYPPQQTGGFGGKTSTPFSQQPQSSPTQYTGAEPFLQQTAQQYGLPGTFYEALFAMGDPTMHSMPGGGQAAFYDPRDISRWGTTLYPFGVNSGAYNTFNDLYRAGYFGAAPAQSVYEDFLMGWLTDPRYRTQANQFRQQQQQPSLAGDLGGGSGDPFGIAQLLGFIPPAVSLQDLLGGVGLGHLLPPIQPAAPQGRRGRGLAGDLSAHAPQNPLDSLLALLLGGF